MVFCQLQWYVTLNKANLLFSSLQDFDDFIFAFFAIEMVIKMVALGIFGKKCYLGDTWNRLDFFIVVAGWVMQLQAKHTLAKHSDGQAEQCINTEGLQKVE